MRASRAHHGQRYAAGVELEKWKRNAVYEAIQAAELDPRDFEWEGDVGHITLTYVPTRAFFIFDGDPGHYFGRYEAGEGPPWPYEVYSWQSLIPRVERWLGEVKRDLETPDLWAELQQERELLGGRLDDAVQNTPFTPEEQAQIAKQLRELKEHVKTTYSLSENELAALDSRLNYLEDAAGRLPRIDWRNLLVGTMLTLIVTALLPPEAVRAILLIALHGLDHLFGGGGTPLAPGGTRELPPVV
jgi:hypothetical protein